jgi:hypothetical protein
MSRDNSPSGNVFDFRKYRRLNQPVSVDARGQTRHVFLLPDALEVTRIQRVIVDLRSTGELDAFVRFPNPAFAALLELQQWFFASLIIPGGVTPRRDRSIRNT